MFLKKILRVFVTDCEDVQNPVVRKRCGLLSGSVGLALNLMLFTGKLLAGILSGAISVTADAFNNLSDAVSSMVTLVGFKLAGREADADHPFGHGRMEYLAGLLVSLLILLVGVELGKSSIEKIIHPEDTAFSMLTAVILTVSVLVKIWMWWFNYALSRHINSDALAAAAADSRSDALATSVVLLGLIIGQFAQVRLDGWLGVLVALFILKTGLEAAKDTLDPLLGKAPEPEMVQNIEEVILGHPPVQSIHDLVIHDYGPGRRMMSVHAEVPSDTNFINVHAVIDHIERELREKFQMDAVIHMDPVQVDDPLVDELRALTVGLAAGLDPSLTIHDFRVDFSPANTTLMFDVVVPYDVKLSDDEVKQVLSEQLRKRDKTWRTVIDIDHSCVM